MTTLYAVMSSEVSQPTHLTIATNREELKNKLYNMYEISDKSFDELLATGSCIVEYEAAFGENLSLSHRTQMFLDTTEL